MQWNAGAWFGSQTGVTLWILVAGLSATTLDPFHGVLVLLLGLVANLTGLGLWRRRGLTCRASMQVLVAVSGLCGLATVVALERAGLWTQIQFGGSVPAWPSFAIVAAVYGGLLLLLQLRREWGSTEHPPTPGRTADRRP